MCSSDLMALGAPPSVYNTTSANSFKTDASGSYGDIENAGKNQTLIDLVNGLATGDASYSNGKIVNGCFGSPLPNLPWRIMVQVWRADIPPTSVGRAITIPLIDVGPDLIEDRGIDLTPSAFLALGGDLKTGLLKVGYRIVEGAKYLHLTSINQGGAK